MKLTKRCAGIARVLVASWIGLGACMVVAAPEEPCSKDEAKPGAATPEKIRQHAQAIRELKQLLADSDATVRLSALDAMLNSCDPAMREVAYEAGFASGDQSMRALAFKHKVLSMTQFVIESVPPENPNDAQKYLVACCLKLPVRVGTRNFATGEFSGYDGPGSVNGLELRVTTGYGVARLRLEDAAPAVGTLSRGADSVAARVVLR